MRCGNAQTVDGVWVCLLVYGTARGPRPSPQEGGRVHRPEDGPQRRGAAAHWQRSGACFCCLKLLFYDAVLRRCPGVEFSLIRHSEVL